MRSEKMRRRPVKRKGTSEGRGAALAAVVPDGGDAALRRDGAREVESGRDLGGEGKISARGGG